VAALDGGKENNVHAWGAWKWDRAGEPSYVIVVDPRSKINNSTTHRELVKWVNGTINTAWRKA